MSYDIDLLDNSGKHFQLGEPHEEGGTYQVGGTKDTTLNITYNYGWYYYEYLDKEKGIRWLYGRKGKDCIERLKAAIKHFENEPVHTDYWANTPGNCIRPLKTLLRWCEQFPEGTFKGD